MKAGGTRGEWRRTLKISEYISFNINAFYSFPKLLSLERMYSQSMRHHLAFFFIIVLDAFANK